MKKGTVEMELSTAWMRGATVEPTRGDGRACEEQNFNIRTNGGKPELGTPMDQSKSIRALSHLRDR